jgi:hypothetical protein
MEKEEDFNSKKHTATMCTAFFPLLENSSLHRTGEFLHDFVVLLNSLVWQPIKQAGLNR